jgi:precorrin-4 methylase
MDALRAQNAGFEIVPGVSSFFAAAAALEADTRCRACHRRHLTRMAAGRGPAV